jgi:hypothetical protein
VYEEKDVDMGINSVVARGKQRNIEGKRNSKKFSNKAVKFTVVYKYRERLK